MDTGSAAQRKMHLLGLCWLDDRLLAESKGNHAPGYRNDLSGIAGCGQCLSIDGAVNQEGLCRPTNLRRINEFEK
jgi:hypothetical protein